MIGAPWTLEDDALLEYEAMMGVSYGRIAEHLERTRTAVLQRSRKIGVNYRRRPWSAPEDDQLRREIADGIDYGAIADLHLRSRNAVRIRAHQLGLTTPKKETTP